MPPSILMQHSLRFPSIDEARGNSAFAKEKSKILGSYEPYKVIDTQGKRGLGGNKKIRALQKEEREKMNRSQQAHQENKQTYKQGVSMTTISSLGFREVPIERISIEDQKPSGRFVKKRKTHAP